MGKQQGVQPPDPIATAQAQTGTNVATAEENARLNRVNTYTPYGSLVYDVNGGGGRGSSGGNIFGYGGGSGGGSSGGGGGGFDTETSILNPGGAGAQYFGLPDPLSGFTNSITGHGNSSAIQDIRRAQAQGKTITDAQWAQAGLPPGGGAYGGGSGGSGGGGNGSQYSATVSLSPNEQYLYDLSSRNRAKVGDTASAMLGQVQDSYARPIDVSGAPGVASHVTQDGATTRDAIKNAQDASYRSQTQYLDPQFEQGQKAMDTKLANWGVAHGSQAENDAQSNFGLSKQRAYQSAQDAATTAGQTEQARLYGQALSDANLQNQGNQQYISNLFALRNQPLNEYNALTSGSQVQNPTFPGIPSATQANTNVAGIFQDNFANQMANQNSQNTQRNNTAATAAALMAAFL